MQSCSKQSALMFLLKVRPFLLLPAQPPMIKGLVGCEAVDLVGPGHPRLFSPLAAVLPSGQHPYRVPGVMSKAKPIGVGSSKPRGHSVTHLANHTSSYCHCTFNQIEQLSGE